MATDYTAIIDAIDAAIEAGVSKPVKIVTGEGKTVEFRTLKDLTDAREVYVRLRNAASRPSRGFRLNKFRAR